MAEGRGANVVQPKSRIRVGIPRGDIDVAVPFPTVARPPEIHPIHRHFRIRTLRADSRDFADQNIAQRIAHEPRVIERLSGIPDRGHLARWHDLVPRAVRLTPERRAPSVVELVQRAVPLPKPDAKLRRANIAETLEGVTTNFVVHVPECDGRMRIVAARELTG